LGKRRFAEFPLQHLSRGVYTVELPPTSSDAFEYYVRVQPNAGKPVFFPATAPNLNRTVVVCGN